MNNFIVLLVEMDNEVKQIAIRREDIDWAEQDSKYDAVLVHMKDGRIIKALCQMSALLVWL